MNSRRLRRRRSWAQLAAVGSLLVGAPLTAAASPEVVAVRGVPSSLSEEFGPAVPLAPLPGVVAVPTGNGADFYDLSGAQAARLGSFRTAGAVTRASAAGTTVFLFAGARGVVAVDASDPASPQALGSIGNLGPLTLGAAAPSGGGVLAAVDSSLHFLAWDDVSGFDLRRSVSYADGRRVAAIAARGDSFLVASNRGNVLGRIILTLYRMRAGAAPESLSEFAFNGHRATDLAWSGPIAFIGDGNLGVLVVNVPARSIVRSVPVLGTKLVRSLDANDSTLVVAAEGRTFVRYTRAGAARDSLAGETVRILSQDPAHARLSGSLAVASTYDQIDVAPPDESGRSLLEFVSTTGGAEPAPVGGTGRVRRVAVASGLAYVADYTGGFRIYRSGGGDSALVGVAPPGLNSRSVDLALDPSLPLAYVASGPAGLEIFRIDNPAAPFLASSLTLPGPASAVTVAAPNLVAVAWRGNTPGVVFVEIDFNPIDSSVVAIARGSVNSPIQDPRALAARDTVLFVADEILGVASIGFNNPDLPSAFGPPSAAPARDLDLTGTQLLVATRNRGLQIVDVSDPAAPILRGEFAMPPLLGVARNGSSAVVFAGEEGAVVVDVSAPATPFARGPIAVPGVARDGVWIGDTLLTAASLSLERYAVSPSPVAVAALQARLDDASALPRALLSWAPVRFTGAVGLGVVGLNVYRDLGTGAGANAAPAGRRVNRDLLPPTALGAVDDSLTAGLVHRYRLEAFLADGSSIKVAEGSVFVPAAPRVGRVYPNPFRPRGGARATLPYRLPAGAGAPVLTLRIYDVAGRMLRQVRTPAQTTDGFGVVAWDGRDSRGGAAPSGTYYLRLTGPGLDGSRVVTLLR
jgi:hypothetical protein